MNRVEERIKLELEGFSKNNDLGIPAGVNPADLVEVIYATEVNGIYRQTRLADEIDWNPAYPDDRIVWYRVLNQKKDKVNFHGEFENLTEAEKDKIINPKHYEIIPANAYKDYPDGMEYMDIMRHALSHLNGVEAHVAGQIFKYLFRLGKKDSKLQDATKVAWYSNRLVKEIENSLKK